MKGAGHMPRRTLKATRKLPRYPPRNPHNPRHPLDINPAAASMVGCESLVSTLENKKTIAERFSARRFLDVQQNLEQGEVHNVIRWPRVENPADGLTKVRGEMSRLLNLLKSGCLVREPFGRAAERPFGIAYGCTPLISRFFVVRGGAVFVLCISHAARRITCVRSGRLWFSFKIARALLWAPRS